MNDRDVGLLDDQRHIGDRLHSDWIELQARKSSLKQIARSHQIPRQDVQVPGNGLQPMRDRLMAMWDRLMAMRDRLMAMRDRLMAMRDRLKAMRDRLMAMRDRLERNPSPLNRTLTGIVDPFHGDASRCSMPTA